MEYKDLAFGVVLEGGGAKGAYQIGAWKALRELGIEIKGVVGTSVGALNGVLIAQGEYEFAYEMWKNIKYSNVMNVDDELVNKLLNLEIHRKDIHGIRSLFNQLIMNVGVDVTPLKELINEVLDEQKIREGKIDYGLVTVNLTDLKPMQVFIEEIEEGRVADLLLASSYLPVFKKEKLHGKSYIDGGIFNNLPVQMLVDKGYENIISIRLKAIGHIKKCEIPDNVNYINIEPNEKLGGILKFDSENSQHGLDLGYYDTLRAFNGYKGSWYYIQTNDEAWEYMNKWRQIPPKAMKWLIKEYGNEDLSIERNLYELILPRIAKKLELSKEWTYEELFITIYEYSAKTLGIERFKVYTLEELSDCIKRNRDKGKSLFDQTIIYICKTIKI